MKGFSITSAVAAVSMLASSVMAADVDPIVIKGSKFFYKTNGTQFFMRGVAYQQDALSSNSSGSSGSAGNDDYTDPLADQAGCTRDLPYLIGLRTNTIRVYAIDPTKNHDACMNMFAGAGIYVVADLSQPGLSINRNNPQWTDDIYNRYTSVVDSMAKYTNTLGFFAGNEVSNQPNNTDASAFVKAAVRDTKAYIKSQNYRTIGVGYATNDDAAIRVDMADYFNCGDAASAIDFWGYNVYSWCGKSSYSTSGYQSRTEEFEKFSVPAFFAEYGCNTQGNRTFQEVGTLYGPDMSRVWSGGIVYMYFQEENDYGLVTVGSGNKVTTFADYSNLSAQLKTVTPSGVNAASYSPTNSAAACPTQGTDWNAKASPLPPSPNQQLCSCMMRGLSCVPKPSVDEEAYGDIFNYICDASKNACNGIQHNATTGTYGAYSMCNSTEQLAWVLNAYYQEQPAANKASACDFSGSATLRSAASATGSCSALIAQAGTGGTGMVTSSPTANGASNNALASGKSGSSSGSGSSSSSSGAASGLAVPSFDFGLLNMGLYVVGAVLSGSLMILL